MTWLGVLRFVGWMLGVVGLGLIMNWAPRKRLSLWQVFGIVSGYFLLSLWLPHLFGPHAILERPGSRSAWRPRCPCWWAPYARA